MTVPSTTNKWIYTGDGSNKVFQYTKRIFANTDLVVEIIDWDTGAISTLTLTTDYSVSGVGADAGGNVTTIVAPASGDSVVIRRVIPITQEIEPVENDPNRAATFEEAIDRCVMIAQQLQEQVGRAVLQNPLASDPVEFPTPDANKVIGWNTAGDALENKTPMDQDAQAAAEAAAEAAEEAQEAAETAQGIAEQAASDAADLVETAQEFEVASQGEAEAGSNNTKLMTPLRTKQHVDARISSTAQAEAGTDDTTVMTPLKVKESIDENAPEPALGSWVSKNVNTVYQAETDGFVVAYADRGDGVEIIGYYGSTSSPDTIATRSYVVAVGHTPRANIMYPVKKGDYWKVAASAWTPSNSFIYWIPFGS